MKIFFTFTIGNIRFNFLEMKKIIYLSILGLAVCVLCLAAVVTPDEDCTKDVKDKRGKMKPWEKGACETGKYRNVFLDAGYKKADIDAKLAKAYHDVFEGPDRVYFEVVDSMAYISDLKNHDARTEGLSYGMMVAVQLNKKRSLTAYGGGPKNICNIREGLATDTSPGRSIRPQESTIRRGPLQTGSSIL